MPEKDVDHIGFDEFESFVDNIEFDISGRFRRVRRSCFPGPTTLTAWNDEVIMVVGNILSHVLLRPGRGPEVNCFDQLVFDGFSYFRDIRRIGVIQLIVFNAGNRLRFID